MPRRKGASAASAVALINALPPGLLEMVFAYIARRPLLRIVALVCQHWARAALRSVTRLTLTNRHDRNFFSRVLPRMTALRMVTLGFDLPFKPEEPSPDTPGGSLLPAHVTALRLECSGARVLQRFAKPPVQQLDVLLPPLWLSLTSLSLALEPLRAAKISVEALLAEAHLPALRTLKITHGWGDELSRSSSATPRSSLSYASVAGIPYTT